MIIKLDKELYSKRVLLKTAFQFIDKVYIHLEQDREHWYVQWEPKENCACPKEEFENALIEETLRLQILHETQDIRKLVLARAFASTLIEIPGKTEASNCGEQSISYDDNIMRSWYDKRDNEI